MARRTSPTIRIEKGDEPRITMLGPFVYMSADGGLTTDLDAMCLDHLEQWSDKLALQIALLRAAIRERAESDEAGDALIYGAA